MKKAALVVVLLSALTSWVFANGGADSPVPDSEGLKVVATTTIVGDVVSQVLGGNGDLTVLMPVGQNPHSYDPAPRDIAAMESADIIFVNGLELEEQLIPVIESLDGPLVVEVSHGLTPREADEHHHDDEDEHGHDEEGEHHDDEDAHGHEEEGEHHDDDHDHAAGDPHFWFSPMNVMHWVHEIEEALSDIDPVNAEAYTDAAEGYEAQLKALDTEIRELIDTVPREDRKLVMDHSSLGYFADDYGFTIIGSILPGFSDQSEPSASEIAEVVETIEDYDVRAIFVGGTASQSLLKLADAVAGEIDRPLPIVSILTGFTHAVRSRKRLS
jgi:ABC-type Zn uptake system ZnuABC Zn-binding protein ZnuA